MRVGKHFEFGYPHIHERGISYHWPNEEQDWDRLLEERKGELGKLLLGNLEKYMAEFDVRKTIPPYIEDGERGLTFHLGMGGRWIEVWKDTAGYFVCAHNLDAYSERAAGFNIGSDTLEHLDPTILAPRFFVEGGRYVMRYPLPAGMRVISHLTEENLRSLYELVGLKPDVHLTNEAEAQGIENSDGVVVVEKGICEGSGFERWNVTKASWIMSRIMSLCGRD